MIVKLFVAILTHSYVSTLSKLNGNISDFAHFVVHYNHVHCHFSSPTKLIDVFSFMMVCLHWMNAKKMDPSLFVPRCDFHFEVIIIELFLKNTV